MKITRLRLLGFKSFVEPTELLVEEGLTGVVGPNGCGKSNLLEALRWAMGETSYKSMRGTAMEDVIFAGSQDRPGRNTAEVTLFINNSSRKAPAEFNDSDVLEVTRRIEREAGSAYKVNGKLAVGLYDTGIVAKVGPARVKELVGKAGISAFEPMPGRIWKDWILLTGSFDQHHAIFEEAVRYVQTETEAESMGKAGRKA